MYEHSRKVWSASVVCGFLFVGTTILMACEDEGFPPEGDIKESTRFFTQNKSGLDALVQAVQRDDVRDVFYSKGGAVFVGPNRRMLTGSDRDELVALLERANVGRVRHHSGCYTIGGGHVPHSEREVTVLLEAPCDQRTSLPSCDSLGSTVPERGACVVALDEEWRLAYTWFTVSSQNRDTPNPATKR